MRITGYGIDSEDPKRHFAQQTHDGDVTLAGGILRESLLEHTVDTMGGNSGSSIIEEESQEIVGILTHGGCGFFGANKGTMINRHEKLKAAIKACLDSELE